MEKVKLVIVLFISILSLGIISAGITFTQIDRFVEWDSQITGNESVLYQITSLADYQICITQKEKSKKYVDKEVCNYEEDKLVCTKEEVEYPTKLKTYGDKKKLISIKDLSKDKDSKGDICFELNPLASLFYKIGEESITLTGITSYDSVNVNITNEYNFSHINISDSKIVAYWTFDANTDDNSIVNWTTGQFGNGLYLDGSNDYVRLGGTYLELNASLTNDLTLAGWFYPINWNSQSSSYSGLIGTNYGPQYGLIHEQTGYFNFNIIDTNCWTNGTGRYSLSSNSTSWFPLNTWTHILVTYDNDTGMQQIYLNGVLSKEQNRSFINLCRGSYTINAGGNGGSTAFNGSIDEIIIFNRSVNSTEASNIANNYIMNSTGLVGHWALNESSGFIAKDSSINENYGDIYGYTRKIYDYSNKSNDGLVYGAVYNASGGYNNSNAYSFDGGQNQGVDVISNSGTSNLGGLINGSISMWIYANGPGVYFSNNQQGKIQLGSARPLFYGTNAFSTYWGGASTEYPGGCSSLGYGSWIHMVAAWENSGESSSNGKIYIYKNGASCANLTGLNLSLAGGTSFNIGSYGGNSPFNGTIDEIMVFNKTLSVTEINKIYTSSYSKFFPSGNMTFRNIDFEYNQTVNVSIKSCSQFNGTNIQVKFNTGDYQSLNSTCAYDNYEIPGSLEYVNMTLLLNSNSNNFYSPIVAGDINLESYDATPPPGLTLIEPANYYNTTNATVLFNSSVTDTWSQGIANLSLYIDGELNDTLVPTSASEEGDYTGVSLDINGVSGRDFLSIDNNGTFIWASDNLFSKVYKLWMNGTYTNDYFDTGSTSQGVTTNNTFIWVLNSSSGGWIHKYWMNGTDTMETFMTGASYACGRSVTQNNTHFFFLCGSNGNAIRIYEIGGTYIGTFSVSTQVSQGRGITTDGNYIWITDSTNSEVFKYYINGTYTENSFDTAASGNTYPRGITENSTTFFITNGTNKLIYEYVLTGTSSTDTSFTKTLSEGAHTWSMLTYNSNSAFNQSETRSLIIDKSAPKTTFELPTPVNASTNNSANIIITANVSDSLMTSSFIDFDRSLVGYWSMDYYNSTHVFDNSSYGRNAEFIGTVFGTSNITTGRMGKGIQTGFNDNYLNTRSLSAFNVNVSQQKSFSVWINGSEQNNSAGAGYVLWNEGNCVGWFIGVLTNGSLYYSLATSPFGNCTSVTYHRIYSTATYEDNQWHNIIGIIDRVGNTMSLYSDSVLVGTRSINGIHSSYGSNYKIGNDWNNGNAFNGTIDEVMLFNRSLSEDEIKAIYNSQSNKFNSSFSSLSTGWHNYTLYSIDQIGNAGTAYRTFKVYSTSLVGVYQSITNTQVSLDVISLFRKFYDSVTQNNLANYVRRAITNISQFFKIKFFNEKGSWDYNVSVNRSLPFFEGEQTYITVFDIGSNKYALVAVNDLPSFYGFVWNGTDWKSNSTINSSTLLNTWNYYTLYPALNTFYKDGSLFLLVGSNNNGVMGFVWNGTTWKVNTTINTSLSYSNVGWYPSPEVFYKDGALFMLCGNDEEVLGFLWNGTRWLPNSTINSSLSILSFTYEFHPTVFYKDNRLEALIGNGDGDIFGFYWNNTDWIPDFTVNDSILGLVDGFAKPEVFNDSNSLKMIIGGLEGPLYGYSYREEDTTLLNFFRGTYQGITEGDTYARTLAMSRLIVANIETSDIINTFRIFFRNVNQELTGFEKISAIDILNYLADILQGIEVSNIINTFDYLFRNTNQEITESDFATYQRMVPRTIYNLISESDFANSLREFFRGANQEVQFCEYQFDDDSLIGWWTMDDYNETGIFDKSNMNDFAVFRGSAFGVSNFTSGHIDEALKFDGNDDYFNITSKNRLDLNNSDFTASFWFRRDGIGACRAYFGKGTGSSTNSGFQIYENCGTYTGQMKYFLGYGSNFYSQYTTTVLQNDTWYLVTLVSYNKNNMTMYINGEYDSYVSTPLLTMDYPTNNIYIGRGVWSANYARATLDELMLWNKALSPDEISNLYLVQSNERECSVDIEQDFIREPTEEIIICNKEYSLCYQETANISTECGGLDTGVYSHNFSDNLLIDGIDGSNSGCPGEMPWDAETCFFYVNYTIPNNANNNSIWTTYDAIDGYFNHTLEGCSFTDVLQFRTTFNLYGGKTEKCWSGTEWILVGNDDPDGGVSEEKMYWNISNTGDCVVNTQRNFFRGTYQGISEYDLSIRLSQYFRGTYLGITEGDTYARSLALSRLILSNIETYDTISTFRIFFRNVNQDMTLFERVSYYDILNYIIEIFQGIDISEVINTLDYLFRSSSQSITEGDFATYQRMVPRTIYDLISESDFTNSLRDFFRGANQEVQFCEYPFNTTDLVGWWNFDINSLTQIDTIGGDNTGTVSNAVYNESGHFSGAYSFDGSGDTISFVTNDDMKTTDSLHVSFWVNLRQDIAGDNWDDLFIFGNGSYNGRKVYIFDYYQGKFGGSWSFNNVGTDFLCNITRNYEEWYFLSYDINNDTKMAKFYQNGVLCASKSFTGTVADATNNFGIYSNWNGTLDELMFFNRSLSPLEIQTIYNLQSNQRECIYIDQQLLRKGLNDGITYSDKLTSLRQYFRGTYQDIDESDINARNLALSRLISDNLGISDIFNYLRTVSRNSNQQISYSDLTTSLRIYSRTTGQQINENDFINYLRTVSRNSNQQISYSDLTIYLRQYIRNTNQQISESDYTTRFLDFLRTSSQGITEGDLVSSLRYFLRGTYLNINEGDAYSRALALSRLITAEVSASDIFGSLREFFRNTNEEISISDNVDFSTIFQYFIDVYEGINFFDTMYTSRNFFRDTSQEIIIWGSVRAPGLTIIDLFEGVSFTDLVNYIYTAYSGTPSGGGGGSADTNITTNVTNGTIPVIPTKPQPNCSFSYFRDTPFLEIELPVLFNCLIWYPLTDLGDKLWVGHPLAGASIFLVILAILIYIIVLIIIAVKKKKEKENDKKQTRGK